MNNLSIEQKFDAAEQHSWRACLRIAGIPEQPNESTDDLVINVVMCL